MGKRATFNSQIFAIRPSTSNPTRRRTPLRISGDRFATPKFQAATTQCYGLAVGEGEIAGGAVDAGADAAPGEETGDGETCVVAGERETGARAVGAGDAWVLANSRRSALWPALLCA